MPVIGDTGGSGEHSPENLEPSAHVVQEVDQALPRRVRTARPNAPLLPQMALDRLASRSVRDGTDLR